MHDHEECPSYRNVSRTWRPFCKLSERYSNAHDANWNGPHPDTHPRSDGQHHRIWICQLQHPPMAFKSHGNTILLGQRQIQTRTISVVLDGWRTQYGRLFQRTPPHKTPSSTAEHISIPTEEVIKYVCYMSPIELRGCVEFLPSQGNGRRTEKVSLFRGKEMEIGRADTTRPNMQPQYRRR